MEKEKQKSRNGDKKAILRVGLGLVQHILAAGIMLVVATILYHSYIGVDSLDESYTYWIDTLNADPLFEDTTVYRQLVYTDAADALRYVALKIMLETEEGFDPEKRIDVTALANQGKDEPNCPITAVYYLDDLIKWGKDGVEYYERSMSVKDFVNYFGNILAPENFAINEEGKLYFDGVHSFARGVDEAEESLFYRIISDIFNGNLDSEDASIYDGLSDVEKLMLNYTEKQLENMAFSYIMSQNLEEISVVTEVDGSYTVKVSMLRFRYDTVEGKRLLTDYASNWEEYCYLQRNAVDCIQKLSRGYELYLNGEALYGEGQSNFMYVVRFLTDDNRMKTYTNFSELQTMDDDDVAEFITGYRRYLVYYLDTLEFSGMTFLSEGDVYKFVRESGYVFPENIRIWMAVDTTYRTEGDSLYTAYQVFDKIVPGIPKRVGVILIFLCFWILIFSYLCMTAGIAYDEKGEPIYRLSFIDKVWTEIHIALTVLFFYGLYRAQQELTLLVDVTNELSAQFLGENYTGIYEYGVFAAFGFLASVLLDVLLLSVIRRLRSRTIWKDSFVFRFYSTTVRAFGFITNHTNVAISALIPYNLFLLVNLIGVLFVANNIANQRENMAFWGAAVMILFDGYIGVRLFRSNAEKIDIVKGINRIREGEVDYKLDVKALSGTNKELADAVNNIGEGIRKAVNTSMKDEQMKSDLITNVSHDLKTPLTSIISYVDLLKMTNIEDVKAKGYIEVLDSKAQRLKQLTDDLVEASKISSGNITLQMERLDLAELVNQAMGEFSEKLEEKGLEVFFEPGDTQAFIYADSRRMWRIIDNLFNNICKYAQEKTRVYIDLEEEETDIKLVLKNISARKINLKGEELAERFIRGDESRTTEGSGLGLFISKSLTQAQGGTFEIQLDGDLFKVVLVFPGYDRTE